MRISTLLACAGLVLASAGWRWTQQSAPPTQKVTITFKCEKDGGGTVTVKPWRAKLGKRTDYMEWSLKAPGGEIGPDSVLIGPKPGFPWPFTTAYPIVVKNVPVTVSGIPPYIKDGTYKYYVTGICNVPLYPNDTVGIDPDMIIPR